jgi:hypothetical protein
LELVRIGYQKFLKAKSNRLVRADE